MLTEQEALAVLNEKITKNELKESTKVYVQKINKMNEMIKNQKASIVEKQSEIEKMESDLHRLNGAVSMLLELAAESEGLISEPENPNNPDNVSK